MSQKETDAPKPPSALGSLRQIQVRFDAEQDRLLLRINTTGSAELRCWLTRRMLRRLWPHLQSALSASQTVAAQPTPVAREAVKSFERESAIAGSDFKTPFDDAAERRPLGDEPILVSKANLGRAGDQLVLRLAPKEGGGVDLRIPNAVLHTLCELIQRAVSRTDWDLDLGASQPAVAAAEPRSLQ